MTDAKTLSAVDTDALRRCVELVLVESDEARVASVRATLATDWLETARYCAYSRQIDALRLLPWEQPPMHARVGGDDKASGLLERLLAAGLSRFEPDPVAALRAVKAAKARA